MREIEKKMLRAIKRCEFFTLDNTMVHPSGDVYLFGNHIAKVEYDGTVKVNEYTLENWPTPTTLSRLRALGVDVCRRKNKIYVDGVFICDA